MDWNGTQGTSMYYEVYNGLNPFSPLRGERDVNCAVYTDTKLNKQACQVFDDRSGVIIDTWDSDGSTVGVAAAIPDRLTNNQGVTGATTALYDVFSYRVSGFFFAGYKPQNMNQKYKQCVRPMQIGGWDWSKCQYFDLPQIETACTNNGIMAASSEVSLGLAALFGSLSFF